MVGERPFPVALYPSQIPHGLSDVYFEGLAIYLHVLFFLNFSITLLCENKHCLCKSGLSSCITDSSGFGGLVVACWPLVPKFAGSNPAEAVGFLRAKKSSARLHSEGK